MELTVPDPSLVLLIGPSGAGKSTFAERHFRPTEIVSSDALRQMLADDAADQGASAEAFGIVALLVEGRLKRRLLTVIDATNLRAQDRQRYLRVAARYGVRSVAIAFDLADEAILGRNAQRPGRVVDDAVVDRQIGQLDRALAALAGEGYAGVHVLRTADEVSQAAVKRVP